MGPLQSLKVLDFSKLLPGPYGSMILADLGAEVLRVEWSDKVDMARLVPPFDGESSATHSYLNRSKKILSLDLAHHRAVEVVSALIRDYDIIIEQFRPGVMESLGLGYEQLRQLKPELIYCSITGFGQTGELSQRAGHDINYLALTGLASYSGKKASGPSLSGSQIADIAGGSHQAVMGILAAVIERQGSGQGQHLDISIADGALAMNGISGAAYSICKEPQGLESGGLNGGGIYDYYRCSDEGYMSVGSLEPKFVLQLLKGLGRLDLAPLAANGDTGTLKAEIAASFRTKTRHEWSRIFDPYDACVEPVLELPEVFAHKHFQHREMFVTVPHGKGSQTQIANPIKFSRSKLSYQHAGRPLAHDNREVLEAAGFSLEEQQTLREQGAFGSVTGGISQGPGPREEAAISH